MREKMEFRTLTYDEFKPITEQQLALLKHLRVLEIFKWDEEWQDFALENGRRIKIGEEEPGTLTVPGLEGIDDRIPEQVHNGFTDVLGIERLVCLGRPRLRNEKDSDLKKEILVLFEEGVYQGATCLFYDEKRFGTMGIRTSIENYLRKKRGIGSRIMDEVIRRAGNRPVIIPDPLDGVFPILKKKGFVEGKDKEDRLFYDPIYIFGYYFIRHSQ